METIKSDHIENRKLCEIIEEKTFLKPAEIEHLRECDECMEVIRVLVRQKLTKGVGRGS